MDRNRWYTVSGHTAWKLSLVAAVAFAMNCAHKPPSREEVREVQGLKLSHKNIVEHVGEGGPDIVVKIVSGSPEDALKEDGVRLYFRERGTRQFKTVHMGKTGSPPVYQASIPHFERGAWVDYYIQVQGAGGELLTFPGDAGEGHYYPLRFKGHVPHILLYTHIWTMFIGLLLFLFASYRSWNYLKERGAYDGIEKTTLYGLLFLFIGGFPLGFLMGYFTFGKPWTGFPVGSDVTDTKTLIVFVYWLIVVGLFRASRAGTSDEKKERLYANLIIWGTLFTCIIYLIPHSI